MAQWLNTAFASFDGAIFNFAGSTAGAFGNFIAEFMDLFGTKGIGFILAALILMCFAKTRRIGVCILAGIIVGALFTNVIIKNAVARPRPYTHEEYRGLWEAVGASKESEHSFPSGHTTSAMACAMALFLAGNKKWSWVGFVVALLMGWTRIYLIVHYATDVIGGLIVGGAAGVIGYFVVKLIYAKVVEKFKNKLFFDFFLNKNVWELFRKKEVALSEAAKTTTADNATTYNTTTDNSKSADATSTTNEVDKK